MTFRFYITLYDGTIRGTNDEGVARNCSRNPDFFVVDVERNLWLTSPNDETVEEFEEPEESDEE